MAAPNRPATPGLLLCLLGGVVAAAWGSAPPAPRICSGCCAGSVRNGSAVAGFCGSRAGAELLGRCCLEGEAVVVGLDLGNCSMDHLCPNFSEASTAVVIDLTINQLEPPPEDAFRGFTQLQTIALPVKLDCPGGSNMWDNITTQGSIRICQGQRNPCNGSGGLGWLCPEDSLCAPDGPGLPQCLCVSPYHGYKCLRQGAFPYLLFYGTLGAVTTGLSILLWVTQRRKVKAS